jgi:hypothetical protein
MYGGQSRLRNVHGRRFYEQVASADVFEPLLVYTGS